MQYYPVETIPRIPRSHALRGNAVTDAPRRVRALVPVLCMKPDAERPR